MPDDLIVDFVFVPNGAPWPADWVRRHPDYITLPAKMQGSPAFMRRMFGPNYGQAKRYDFQNQEARAHARPEALEGRKQIGGETSAQFNPAITEIDWPRTEQVDLGPSNKAAAELENQTNAARKTSRIDLAGVAVVLPDGQTVPDPYNKKEGVLMSPVADLRPVAKAGRQTGEIYRIIKYIPIVGINADLFLAAEPKIYLGHGGVFDYQRSGNFISGFAHYRDFRDVSNFNVGLFCQQLGLSLDEVLTISGKFASLFSNNAMPDKPYGLDPRNIELTSMGYKAGQSGQFSTPPSKD